MTDAIDFKNAIAFIQQPREALKLSAMITDRLCGIREVEVIPDRVYNQVAEVVAEFYALGYVRGMRVRK